VPKSLRHSCRSELHVRPRFPAAQTIRSPDRSELRARSFSWSGPASYEAFRLHPGISPLSRYGDRIAPVLPSVLPVAPCRRREGSTDLSWKCGRDRSRPGQFHLPDKEFRLILLLHKRGGRSFLPTSACRHAVRTFSSALIRRSEPSGVKSLRISGSLRIFPADYLHSRHCHCRTCGE
jgi:hypothetical protein